MDTQGSGTGAQWTPEETRSYYSADDKLMYYERHVGWADPGDEPGVFEEYRYDAPRPAGARAVASSVDLFVAVRCVHPAHDLGRRSDVV